jgi:hypothetical protein
MRICLCPNYFMFSLFYYVLSDVGAPYSVCSAVVVISVVKALRKPFLILHRNNESILTYRVATKYNEVKCERPMTRKQHGDQ